MNTAYQKDWLYNLAVIKETKRWFKQDLIEKIQLDAIHLQYQAPFYHPNFIIRILLFVATLFALSGLSGLLGLMVGDLGEITIAIGCIIYGVVSFYILDTIIIKKNKHYKSGVTEGLLYHACGFTIGGLTWLTDFNIHFVMFTCLVVFSFAAIRYLDLVTTLLAILSFAGIIFYEFYNMGGIMQKIIPFIFIICFTPLYFLVRNLKARKEYCVWINNLIIVESVSLLFVYAAGNYLVVRELSVNLMELYLEPEEDIPFAFIFYALTIIIPVGYLYFGIKRKDIVLLRVSLAVLAFSVFTFKYYYGFGHPEISLTLAGAVLLIITLLLLNYLKIMRNGFTRENLLAEKWGNINVQAIIVSQTMGGNEVVVEEQFKGGGGEFGGGGASGNY